MRRFVLAALAIGLSTPAWGQGFTYQADHRYTYLQADYIPDAEIELLGDESNGDGYGGKISVSISPHAYLALEYHSIDNSDGDIDNGSIGLGLRTELIESLDVYGSANYEHADLTIPGVLNGDADGYGGRLGLRLFVDDHLELSVEGRLADLGEERIFGADVDIDSQFIVLGGVFRFTDALALTFDYLTGEYEFDAPADNIDLERDDVRVGLRWYLDP